MMHDIRKSGYEILQYSLCEGWVNNLYIDSDTPYVFATLEEAVCDLQDEFDDWQAEVINGLRGEDEDYEIEAFRIIDNNTGIVYELDLIEQQIVIVGGQANN